jgi:hypothetical protein
MSNLMEDVNTQIRRLVERVLSLPDGYMRPANQRADAGKQTAPFGTVLIMNAENVGWAARATEDDGAGGLNEVLEVPVQVVASVQFFKNAPRPADLRGAAISDDVSMYTSVTNGGFDIRVDGSLVQLSALDLSAATSMADVATALAGGLALPVTWTGKRFVISGVATDQTGAVGAASAPTAGGSPDDVSTLLGLTLAAGASPSDNKSGFAKSGLDAVDLARRLTLVLQFGQHASYMQAVGLGYLRAGQVRDLSFVTDSNFESRASVDLTFNFIARESLPVAAFEPPFEIGIKAEAPGGAIRDVDLSVTPPT